MDYAGAVRFTLLPGLELIGNIGQLCADGGIELSSGIVPGSEQYPALGFAPQAYVPKLPWRAPDEAATGLLSRPTSGHRPGQWLQHFRAPSALLECFARLRAASMDQAATLTEEWVQRNCGPALEDAAAYATTLTQPESGIDSGHVFVRTPGLPTTAAYPVLVGLHIDTAYSGPVAARRSSPNRLSVNLGCDDRFLLFVNLDVSQIDDLLKAEGVTYRDEPDVWTHGLRSAFMSRRADYPVIKLRIRPGEAYLAPTENVIHDGCTTGQRYRDIQYSARGRFHPVRSS